MRTEPHANIFRFFLIFAKDKKNVAPTLCVWHVFDKHDLQIRVILPALYFRHVSNTKKKHSVRLGYFDKSDLLNNDELWGKHLADFCQGGCWASFWRAFSPSIFQALSFSGFHVCMPSSFEYAKHSHTLTGFLIRMVSVAHVFFLIVGFPACGRSDSWQVIQLVLPSQAAGKPWRVK